jgi:hypothetical protein
MRLSVKIHFLGVLNLSGDYLGLDGSIVVLVVGFQTG